MEEKNETLLELLQSSHARIRRGRVLEEQLRDAVRRTHMLLQETRSLMEAVSPKGASAVD